MRSFFKKLTLSFSAGCLGGLINSLVVFLFGVFDITAMFGVNIAPSLTPQWLYQRIVWGGIWGVLFLFPLFKRSYTSRGLLLSLGPTIVQLFIVFPIKAQKGLLGFELGILTPLFVIFFNAVWGITTAYWLKFVGRQ
jgi:hypothetical protein